MNHQRYTAYQALVSELDGWHSEYTLGDQAHGELCDAAEGLLLARGGADAEEPLTRASSTVLAMLADDELEKPDAVWVLDRLLACGPRFQAAEAVGGAA
jgi:hypothetical protein